MDAALESNDHSIQPWFFATADAAVVINKINVKCFIMEYGGGLVSHS